MEVRENSSVVLTRWYAGGSYIKDSVSGVRKEYTFIGGDAYSAPVVAVKQNGGTPVYYYLLRDHLGSITHIVNASNNTLAAEYSYDAWGRMRNPSTWLAFAPGTEPTQLIAGRGYTGHEHLPLFNLINMNGRVYDPLTGQFLSADNYVQSPDFTQSLNRYAYCLNNPLIYNDPTGEFWHIIIGAIFGSVVGNVQGVIEANSQGMNRWDAFKHVFFKVHVGGAAGAVAAITGGGVSAAMAPGGSFAAGALGTSAVTTTGFAAGAISGAASGAVGGFINGTANSLYEGKSFGQALTNGGREALWGAAIGGVVGGVAGGIDAVNHNRDFWTGAGRQDVVVKVNSQGTGEIISATDYNSSAQSTRDYYNTTLNNNAGVTTNTNGQVSIRIPNEVDRITGIQAPNSTPLMNVEVGRKFISFTPIDRTSYVILHGWRYHSNPVTSLRNLFYFRTTF